MNLNRLCIRLNMTLEVNTNYTNTEDNVTKIEKNNRTVEERHRTKYHRLPFQNIPKVMIRHLAFEVFRKLIYSPLKGGLPPYYSPQTSVDQQPLYYNKHFKIPFGALVQAKNYNNPKN